MVNTMRLAGIVIAVGFLQGCFGAPSIDDTMDEYTTRLFRVLDKPLSENEPPLTARRNLVLPSQTYPTLFELGNNVTTLNINIREFYAIQDCELGRIVAERNTALGKTQLPSQRLQYEHRVLNALANCEARLKATDNPIASTVAEWRKQKQAQYQSVWANVVQTSTEMKLGLSMAGAPLQASENKDAKASVNALNFINGLAKTLKHESVVEGKLQATSESVGDGSVASASFEDASFEGANIVEKTNDVNVEVSASDSGELEQQLQIIASSRLPAKLWQTQAILHNRLVSLNQVLAPALNSVQCKNGVTSDKATILRNVFYLYFIEEIQPIASTLNSYHYQLQPLWKQWAENAALSAPFKAHIRTHAIDNFVQYSARMKAHVSLWQDFLGRCNLSPTAP
ncbi:hypothetical protein AOR13_1976 [Alteromonas stellipolaris LMG 21856]|uniref:DUF3080 domain-containing protein n=2 Tax=Alteromonas stellipolaris TaxID=233316 RepID=A0ABN4LMV9_9ALTE|nr:DUF3080 family protein [Alteromonas stellipolaris]ALM91006.1 hypothetical protein AOR13_1976 [Alteromonas stellipolaris LMG 21856]AMJ74030.1 hypothetical protein AVL57_08605 [Alteromonas stellipolaris]